MEQTLKEKLVAILDKHVDEKGLLVDLVKEVVLVELHKLAEKSATKVDDMVVEALEKLVASKLA